MSLIDLEFEDECCRRCSHCYRARDMMKLGEKGHTLRFRDDTKEWVHDFIIAKCFSHFFCKANQLRKDRNG